MLSLCLAISLDGKLNSEGQGPPEFTSRADRERLFRLRAESDLILVGAGTVRQEQLPPLVRDPDLAGLRRGRSAHPAVAVVTASQRLPFDSAYFRQREQEIYVVAPRLNPETVRHCEELGLVPIEMGDGGLRAALRQLAELGCRRMLAEGGGRLVHALLAEDLVERLYLTLAPTILGGTENPSLAQGPALEPAPGWRLDRARPVGDELHLSYTRQRD